MLTMTSLKEALPESLRGSASQELLDKVNQASTDPLAAEAIRENFVSYSTVLKDGRFKMHDYLNAVSYVSFKLMGYTNQESYRRAFPKRYQDMVAAGRDAREISAYVANYNKGKLVNLILEQSLIPNWVLNQDIYQKAIETQLRLMTTAASEKVQSDAADSLLNHLKRPETKKVEIDLGVKRDDGLESLRAMMTQLASAQRESIEGGTNTREIAHARLVEREVFDEEPMRDVTPAAEPESDQSEE